MSAIRIDQKISLIWNAPTPCSSKKCETCTSAWPAIVSPPSGRCLFRRRARAPHANYDANYGTRRLKKSRQSRRALVSSGYLSIDLPGRSATLSAVHCGMGWRWIGAIGVGGCDGFRLFHAERQSLRKQYALLEPIRRRHHSRSAIRREGRHALGLDRRTSFQFARRFVLPGYGARLCRRQHDVAAACAGGQCAAAASSDPRRRAMGDARSPFRRPRRFRLRARLRQARISAVPRFLRGQSRNLRRRLGASAQAVAGGRPHLASRQILFIRRCAHYAEADSTAAADLCRLILQALDRACGAARLRPDRGAVRRGDELRWPQTGGRPLPRDLRQTRQETGPADVQLLYALRR